ncbi:HAMP domain-containing histidine kinase (plasmid) [Embleya sp. NBC_00888]|uniref:sensor histidine kinase n=1 Tax=Embleya sp. NBC_00888 TaxID=2975960 RepID=UPI002F908D99|nr:HAMP domain-containing histidine kinase [Embleya sp. NBC_00888]
MARRVPLHRSLLVRLLASSILVAACAVAATAWLAAQTTEGAIREGQSRVLADDTRIYRTLSTYAATHTQWTGVEPILRDLSRDTGRRIALATREGVPIADSDAGPASPPFSRPSAVVDPLAVDAALVPTTGSDRIDPEAVGPFRLTDAERAQSRGEADAVVQCLRAAGRSGDIEQRPNGRSVVTIVGGSTGSADPTGPVVTPSSPAPAAASRSSPGVVAEGPGPGNGRASTGVLGERCGLERPNAPTATETKALAELNGLFAACLQRRHIAPLTLGLDLTWDKNAAPGAGRDLAACVDTARREQLTPYVVPATLLFVGDHDGSTAPVFDLSRADTVRIAGVAALILLLTAALTGLVAARLIRPLTALTDAAQRMRDGDDATRVDLTANHEIGRLAEAFNDMSEHRRRMEEQRKEMVGDVAHELRTPLSNIRGWLEAIEDGVVAPDRALTSSLLEEALLLQHVIDDLQDLAEADAGRLGLRLEAVSPLEVCEQVAAAHLARATAADVALVVRGEADLSVPADPVRLRQMVGNLVSNAVRHTPRGGSVTLHAYRDGPQVVFEVTDTGTGIAAHDLPHVFDRFWRADKSRNRRTGGSGLGLAITHRLTHAHAGTITARSTPDVGSVFTIRLPT